MVSLRAKLNIFVFKYMSRLIKYSWLIVVMVATACFEKDVFPDTPQIALEDIEFIDAPNEGAGRGLDTLSITFSFKDGGSNIGLDPINDIGPPFNIFNGIFDSELNVVTINNFDTLKPPFSRIPIGLLNTSGGAQYFFFPESAEFFSDSISSVPPYDCDNYLVVESDTVLGSKNEFHQNLFIQFELKTGPDSYNALEFDPCAAGFNGRIPLYPDASEGIINYKVNTLTLRLTLQDNVFRVRMFVYDRGLQKSNEVVTDDIILADITQ